MVKTLDVTSLKDCKEKVLDTNYYGPVKDLWVLLCKISSESEGWMKSTKAMQIDSVGCLVQVTTQQGKHIAEALSFVPGVMIKKLDKGAILIPINEYDLNKKKIGL